jgi:hypothetical protein
MKMRVETSYYHRAMEVGSEKWRRVIVIELRLRQESMSKVLMGSPAKSVLIRTGQTRVR